MLLRDLPLEAALQFGDEKLLNMSMFRDPQNHPAFGVQYITDAGRKYDNGFNHEHHPQGFEIWEPLGGPFFRLPLLGMVWMEDSPLPRQPPKKKAFVVVADNGGKPVDSTCMIGFDASVKDMDSFGIKHGIHWLVFGPKQGDPFCAFRSFKEYAQFLKQTAI